MWFNTLLALAGLRSANIAIALHKPENDPHRLFLSYMAENNPRAFEACQSTLHGTLNNRSYLASLVLSGVSDQNPLGRWPIHVVGPRTDGFQFSIVELLSPAAYLNDVTTCERTWMDRLHTRRYGLNA